MNQMINNGKPTQRPNDKTVRNDNEGLGIYGSFVAPKQPEFAFRASLQHCY